MILIIIYLAILTFTTALLFYLSGIREGILQLLFSLIIVHLWLFIERLIDKQFDSVTILVCLIVVCMTVIFFWLRKKLSYSLNNDKRRKKKR